MTIFGKLFMSKNGFLLITLIFVRDGLHLKWLPIPNRLFPVVLKGQNIVLGFSFFFRARFFLSGPSFFCRARLVSSFFGCFRV